MHFECLLLLSFHLSSVSHCDMSDFARCLVVFAAHILSEGFCLLKAKGGECCYNEVGFLVQAYVLSLILFQASRRTYFCSSCVSSCSGVADSFLLLSMDTYHLALFYIRGYSLGRVTDFHAVKTPLKKRVLCLWF